MPKKPTNLPEVIELTEAEVEEAIQKIEQSALDTETKKIAIKSIELSLWFPQMLQNKNISLHRLRRLIFGKGYKMKDKEQSSNSDEDPDSGDNNNNKKNDDTAQDKGTPSTPPQQQSSSLEEEQNAPQEDKKPGHGRMPYATYSECEELVKLSIDNLKPGDPCPELCDGRLSQYGPGNIIRVKGQNFARVIHYEVEKLRCNLCSFLVVANIPPKVGNEKYDPAFKSIMVLQKYYVGVPFYRQEKFQALLNFPLPDATQWRLIEQVAECCWEVFEELKRLAANGNLIHNDDTTLKILEHIKTIKSEVLERVGMFTTGIFAEYQGHPIALFLNGTQHAGENLNDLLELRDENKSPILQMCDGSSQNIPQSFQTILCNCLSHGFRKFEELKDYYPDECIMVMKYISQIYDVDKQTVDLTPKARLTYHQKNSQPIVDALFAHMNRLKQERLVEPNSELGGAIEYMLKREEKLTRFLKVEGAPLDNNVVERALKLPIRVRKASLFYRSKRSAKTGGLLTSLAYTCQLAEENPQHYFIALQEHRTQVSQAPPQWLPWNYRETLKALDSS